ncbi:hypothetical protein ACFQS1_19485 [Paractinoplanes rhizophilus]|uniref:Uncharacterized protein n=1 Tax=Paractinoplanes rhizophilus TaxID=1416877 RepID=A0ABW2HUQ4_9ACTN
MAGLDGTNEPLTACNSCQRAVTYGVLGHLSTGFSQLEEGDFLTAGHHVSYAIELMLEIAKTDFTTTVPSAIDMADDDWRTALAAFIESRIDHYTDADSGAVVFEPHDDNSEPTGVAG